MENKEHYIEDIKEIKEMMSKSSKFISLSGLSGVAAGVVALLGVVIAHHLIGAYMHMHYKPLIYSNKLIVQLIALGIVLLIIAISSSVYFTRKKAAALEQSLWDKTTKTLLLNLVIPLVTGGLVCIVLLLQGFIGLMAPLTLIFYGLALESASKYTYNELRYLGLLEIILGLFSLIFIGYGLIFWGLGFGVSHIIYGIRMQLKYT